MTVSHTTSCRAWRIHHLTFPSLYPSVPHCWISKLDSECFPMGNCRGIFFSHPLVPIVCSAALKLAANQSQSLSYTNKQGIVASPGAGTQQSSKQFGQVIAARRNRQRITQTPSSPLSSHARPQDRPTEHQGRQANAWESSGKLIIYNPGDPVWQQDSLSKKSGFSWPWWGRNKIHSMKTYSWIQERSDTHWALVIEQRV